MGFTQPTATDFKNYFVRDFPYGTTVDTVMDADIVRALSIAALTVNSCFFSTQANYNTGFLLMSAHQLVMNLQASSQGIAGSYTWLTASRGAGAVNEAYQIPQRVLDNPMYAMFSKTIYGAQYLQLVIPQLVGNVFTVPGATQP